MIVNIVLVDPEVEEIIVVADQIMMEELLEQEKKLGGIAGAGAGGAIGGPGGKIAGGLVGEELGDLVMKQISVRGV